MAPMVERFGLDFSEHSLRRPCTSVRPRDRALVLGPGISPLFRRWGFEIDWAKSPLFNAKSEELMNRRTWKPWVNSRCLIPATAYFEGRKADASKRRISIKNCPIFSIAGLMNGDCFTMLTCNSATAIKDLHQRMPCILDPSSENDWLNPGIDFGNVETLLRPCGQELHVEIA